MNEAKSMNPSVKTAGIQVNHSLEPHGEVTSELVVWCYRILLGRAPESEVIVRNCLQLPNQATLIGNIMRSTEFRARAIRETFLSLHDPFVQGRVPQGFKLWVDLRDTGVSIPCLFGAYEPAETQYIASQLAEGDAFVDVGANIGWHTFNACQRVGVAGRIYAFEPRAETRDLLERSVSANSFDGRVLVYPFGLAEKSAAAELHWAPATDNPGGTSLAVGDAGSDMAEEIQLRALDSFSIRHRVRLMKLDIEGAEPRAIRGAKRLISDHRPIIVSEVHDRQLLAVSGITARAYVAEVTELGYRASLLASSGGLQPLEDHLLGSGCLLNVVFEPAPTPS